MIETFTLRLPNGLKQELKKIAKNKGLTMNALIVSALWEWYSKTNEQL